MWTEVTAKAIRAKFMLAWALLCSLTQLAAAADVVLWPSDATELRAQPDSRIATLPDGAMAVETGVAYRWPGVRMDFLSGECDLSAYGLVVVSVSNTTDVAQTVHLSVKGSARQGRCPGGSVKLAPHASGEICAQLCKMPWALDEPLELRGMRGSPAEKGGATFDLRRTRSFHVFRSQDGAPGGFSVRRIEVSHAGVKQKVLSAKAFLPFVDMYGQFMHDDWPGKIHSDGELAAARAAEDAWLRDNAAGPIPESDKYGGWAGGPQLKATGFFRTEKVGGKWWLVDPDGRLFFSLGVNAVRPDSPTGASGRENYFAWLPQKDDPCFGGFYGKQWSAAAHGFYGEGENVPFVTFDFARANAFRKYGDAWKTDFAMRSTARLGAWGLNTVTSWSDAAVQRGGKVPYTVKLSTKGPVIEGSAGWWGKLRDPFSEEFAENLRKAAAEEAALSGGDPWCIGWFVDNELGWGDDDMEIGRAVLRSPASQPAKIAAVELLEREYGSMAALDKAWGTDYGSADALLEASVTNAPDKAFALVHRHVAARYYSTVRDAVKAAAPDILYLGSRISTGKKAVYEECARCCDVVSVNIYDTIPRRDLPEGAADRPMLVAEFHVGATDRGMFHAGLVAASDQAERAEIYRNYVNACLDHPRYVGAHWFQWRDQPLTGRPDGENYAIGLVDITDAPHVELVAAVRETAAGMYQRRSQATISKNQETQQKGTK